MPAAPLSHTQPSPWLCTRGAQWHRISAMDDDGDVDGNDDKDGHYYDYACGEDEA